MDRAPANRHVAAFSPDLPPDIARQASQIITNHMLQAVQNGRAALYPHAEKVLQTLAAQGHVLVLVSHCKIAYLSAHSQHFHLDRSFKQLVASESFDYQDKATILAQLTPLYPGPYAMIGDRASDIFAGRANHMLTIGCTYGYAAPGELDQADIRISAIASCLNYFQSLYKKNQAHHLPKKGRRPFSAKRL
jgi:phosphoglycolate phosphatase